MMDVKNEEPFFAAKNFTQIFLDAVDAHLVSRVRLINLMVRCCAAALFCLFLFAALGKLCLSLGFFLRHFVHEGIIIAILGPMASIVCGYCDDILNSIFLAFCNDRFPFVTDSPDCIVDLRVIRVYELRDIILIKDCHDLSSKLENFDISKGFGDVHIMLKSGV